MVQLTGADDVAARVEGRVEAGGALAHLIAALQVPVAVDALGAECTALVQLLACVCEFPVDRVA